MEEKNNGSSFVVVVVSLTFIGIIALALLSITLMNYKRMAISICGWTTKWQVSVPIPAAPDLPGSTP